MAHYDVAGELRPHVRGQVEALAASVDTLLVCTTAHAAGLRARVARRARRAGGARQLRLRLLQLQGGPRRRRRPDGLRRGRGLQRHLRLRPRLLRPRLRRDGQPARATSGDSPGPSASRRTSSPSSSPSAPGWSPRAPSPPSGRRWSRSPSGARSSGATRSACRAGSTRPASAPTPTSWRRPRTGASRGSGCAGGPRTARTSRATRAEVREWRERANEPWNPARSLADRVLDDARLPYVKIDTLRYDPYNLDAERLLELCERRFPQRFDGRAGVPRGDRAVLPAARHRAAAADAPRAGAALPPREVLRCAVSVADRPR